MSFCKTILLFVLLILITIFACNSIGNIGQEGLDNEGTPAWAKTVEGREKYIRDEFKKSKYKGVDGHPSRDEAAGTLVKGSAPPANEREFI